MIDLTVSLGNILTIVGFGASVTVVIYAVRRDVDVLASKIAPLEAAANRIVDKLESILDRQARHDERIQAIERERDRTYPHQQRRQT